MRIFYSFVFTCFLFAAVSFAQTAAPTPPAPLPAKPLSQAEYVQLLYTLERNPSKLDETVEAIRKRGIGFTLTDGLKNLTASKSKNDATLRRTLEEAARRKADPEAAKLPSANESTAVLAKAREAALKSLDEMPDFLVKQVVIRSIGYAGTNKFTSIDRLLIGVGYRTTGMEEYRVLSVNGIPQQDTQQKNTYGQVGGSTSTGEFVNELATIFKPETETQFEIIDTDTVRGRRTLVYSFTLDKSKGRQRIGVSGGVQQYAIVGEKGKLWIDRENFRVLRVESENTQIPEDFPMRSTSLKLEYDWVMINEQKYLLPLLSEVRMVVREGRNLIESRNEIRFREYRKFDVDIKILDAEEPAEEEAPVKKP